MCRGIPYEDMGVEMSECGLHVLSGNASASSLSFQQGMCSTYKSTALDDTALVDLKRRDSFSIAGKKSYNFC